MIRLEHEDVESLTLDDWETGIVCEELDVGWPTTRSVVTNRPSADGTIDETSHVGARVLSVKLNVFAGQDGQTRRSNLDRLARFCHPGLRPRLVWADPTDGVERVAELRADDGSAPMANDTLTPVGVTWVVPSGLFTKRTGSTVTAAPAADVPGMELPLTFPLTFPPFVGGPIDVEHDGSAPAEWIARLYGPLTGPTLENVTTGQKLSLPGLGIDAGHYLEIDSAQRTIRVDGLADANRYSWLDFAESEWWTLPPGTSSLAFTADVSTTPAQMIFVWHDTSIL